MSIFMKMVIREIDLLGWYTSWLMIFVSGLEPVYHGGHKGYTEI
jgi:hypothetical protein